jgi:hypothetical protein
MLDPLPLSLAVWVRRDCVRWADRGPYHWTAECIEGRALVELDRRQAEAMSNLRPCKLCASRARRATQLAVERFVPRGETDPRGTEGQAITERTR